MSIEDPRLFEAKSIPIAETADRLGIAGLRRTGAELTGPCPMCGGRDRFNINTQTNAFLCRKCGIKGGDQIALVREVMGLSFRDALQWLCGDAPAQFDPAELDRRRKRAAEAERRQKADQERYRLKAIRDARSIWQRARPGHIGVVAAYLSARGITPDLFPSIPAALRFLPHHPYVKRIDRELVTLHRGPCMIAGILSPAGTVDAVHQTWVDRAPPHGKAAISYQGRDYPSKMVRGSKKGGCIRLFTPADATVLVVGEGIETTLSALVADVIPGAAYWAGVDLGNMSGQMRRVSGARYSGLPDMDDAEAFLPPKWVRRLIFIQDGDSDEKPTRAKLECGLRRAMAHRPGLKAQIVRAGEGVDLNDVLLHGRRGPEETGGEP